jgi:TonB family protein
MKPLFLLTLFLTCAGRITTNAQDTIYLDNFSKPTTAQKAAFFRIAVKSTVGWTITDRRLSGQMLMTGAYADDSFHVRTGNFILYDSGIVVLRCMYANNKPNGGDTAYYYNGQVRMIGNMADGDRDGDWIGYYRSGKISGKATYSKGKQVSATFYHEDGSPDKSMTIFYRESEYPGGPREWLNFLTTTLRYPRRALKQRIEGTVIIRFLVHEDGKVSDFEVIQSVDKDLDAEALRVMRLSPEWSPPIVGGIYTYSHMNQPVIFKLQSQ